MGDLYMDIENALAQGLAPEQVAQMFEVPVGWVYEVFLMMDSNETTQFNLKQ